MLIAYSYTATRRVQFRSVPGAAHAGLVLVLATGFINVVVYLEPYNSALKLLLPPIT